MQIQNQLSSGDSAFNILKKPDHILSFIKHALQTATQKPAETRKTPVPKILAGLKLEDLRIVDAEDGDNDEIVEGDSDDEDEPSAPREGSDEEMTSTALNLLLAVMEGMSRYNISMK